MMHVVQSVEGTAIVLVVHGRLEFSALRKFDDALTKAEETHPAHIILDLSHTGFIDSGGVGRLVATFRRLGKSSIRFTLTNQSSLVDRLLRDLCIHSIIPTVASVEDALNLPALP